MMSKNRGIDSATSYVGVATLAIVEARAKRDAPRLRKQGYSLQERWYLTFVTADRSRQITTCVENVEARRWYLNVRPTLKVRDIEHLVHQSAKFNVVYYLLTTV